MLGETDKALAWLERSIDTGNPCWPFFRIHPFLESLRGAPRFQELMNGLERKYTALDSRDSVPAVSLQEYAQISRASNASLDEVRTVWETNVFGVLAVYQAMLPLLRESSDARIINVSSAVGSLTSNADPAYPYHPMFGPVYPASKAALNAITLAMMVELESTGIKVNLVSPGFTRTNLNGYAGTQSVEEGSREVVRVALLGADGPTGTFTRWENVTIPW